MHLNLEIELGVNNISEIEPKALIIELREI